MNEEWRAVPDWPGYEVSSLARVRKVRLLAGKEVALTWKGKTKRVPVGIIFQSAFNLAPVAEASMLRVRRPGDLWRVVRSCLITYSNAPVGYIVACILDDDAKYGVSRKDTRYFRIQLGEALRKYVEKGLIQRATRGHYSITELGRKSEEIPCALS